MKRTIDFEKTNNKWYVIMPDYPGDHEDLEMVEGADIFLDKISTDGKFASIEVYDTQSATADCAIMEMIDHDDYGATYQVKNSKDYNNTVWLCNVTHLFFRGEHPERIYFKVNREEIPAEEPYSPIPAGVFKKIKVTAVHMEQRKSITITADMKDYGRCQSQEAVRKAIEKKILETKIFRKEDLPKLKYQGRKEVLDEWKEIHKQFESTKPQYDLDRFLSAQESAYPIALEEMQEGHKYSHWIWYIFPQQKGLGHSYNSQYYGLDGIDEAREYLNHPVLGARLREISEALLQHKGKDIHEIMGSSIDVLKLKTSMHLFAQVSPNDIFDKVLTVFFQRIAKLFPFFLCWCDIFLLILSHNLRRFTVGNVATSKKRDSSRCSIPPRIICFSHSSSNR